MYEYCGGRSEPAITALIREHERVIDLVDGVHAAHRGGDVPRMAHLAKRIAALLEAHVLVEERGLFPPLEARSPEQFAALRKEHRMVAAVLAETADAPCWDAAWAARLLGALDLLCWHIRKEDDQILAAPAALR